MTVINSYGKIYNLGHAALKSLFNEEVVIQEKLDGCFSGETLVHLSDGTKKTN